MPRTGKRKRNQDTADNYLGPETLVRNFGEQYPGSYQLIADVRSSRHQEDWWPDWCYIAVAAFHKMGDATRTSVVNIIILCALGTWRMTKGVYQFDKDTFDALWNTNDVKDVVPTLDLLRCLPEDCVYILTPGKQFQSGEPLQGVFVRLDYMPHLQEPILYIIGHSNDKGVGLLAGLSLGTGLTIGESIAKDCELDTHLGFETNDADKTSQLVASIMSLVLYICTQAREIRDTENAPFKSRPLHTRKSKGRLEEIPADKPTQWKVGYRIGAALRKAYNAQAESVETDATGSRKCPHIRRGHWHTFLKGPRNQERQRVVKWLPPIPINVDDPDDLVTTVRPVS